jgi:hypothetical protein
VAFRRNGWYPDVEDHEFLSVGETPAKQGIFGKLLGSPTREFRGVSGQPDLRDFPCHSSPPFLGKADFPLPVQQHSDDD